MIYITTKLYRKRFNKDVISGDQTKPYNFEFLGYGRANNLRAYGRNMGGGATQTLRQTGVRLATWSRQTFSSFTHFASLQFTYQARA